MRILTRVAAQEPLALGTVVVHGDELRCVVVDMDAEPLVEPAWVEAAARAALRLAAARGATAVGLELLGAVRGGLSSELSIRALAAALQDAPAGIGRAWLDAEPSVVSAAW